MTAGRLQEGLLMYFCFYFNDCWPSIEWPAHGRFRCTVRNSVFVSATVRLPLKGLLMAGFIVLCLPLFLFQRSVLNATDGQKVHGHGHDVIVYRPPTFKRPRLPDVNTVNPPFYDHFFARPPPLLRLLFSVTQ